MVAACLFTPIATGEYPVHIFPFTTTSPVSSVNARKSCSNFLQSRRYYLKFIDFVAGTICLPFTYRQLASGNNHGPKISRDCFLSHMPHLTLTIQQISFLIFHQGTNLIIREPEGKVCIFLKSNGTLNSPQRQL